jgi:hypothetical protein
VFHREDMPDDLKVEKLCLSVFNGYLKYYEGGYLREMYFFEKNTFKAAYYYDCTGKLISVIEYNKKGKPIKNKKSTH